MKTVESSTAVKLLYSVYSQDAVSSNAAVSSKLPLLPSCHHLSATSSLAIFSLYIHKLFLHSIPWKQLPSHAATTLYSGTQMLLTTLDKTYNYLDQGERFSYTISNPSVFYQL